MASFTLKAPHVTIDGNDMSADVQSITFTRTKDAPQSTAGGDSSHEYLADGMKDATFNLVFRQDFAASAVDAILDGIYDSTSAVTFSIRPTTAAVGTGNPSFSGSCILTDYAPLDGSIGDLAQTSPAFQVTGGVTRATA